jgi:Zn finger protein HypA/HybF involved in hydrogenase expression
MIRVVERGTITARCRTCGSVLDLDHGDARQLPTSPPTWEVTCPVCASSVSLTCAAGTGALISQFAARDHMAAWQHSTAARLQELAHRR